jgi:hypothetical protein
MPAGIPIDVFRELTIIFNRFRVDLNDPASRLIPSAMKGVSTNMFIAEGIVRAAKSADTARITKNEY